MTTTDSLIISPLMPVPIPPSSITTIKIDNSTEFIINTKQSPQIVIEHPDRWKIAGPIFFEGIDSIDSIPLNPTEKIVFTKIIYIYNNTLSIIDFFNKAVFLSESHNNKTVFNSDYPSEATFTYYTNINEYIQASKPDFKLLPLWGYGVGFTANINSYIHNQSGIKSVSELVTCNAEKYFIINNTGLSINDFNEKNIVNSGIESLFTVLNIYGLKKVINADFLYNTQSYDQFSYEQVQSVKMRNGDPIICNSKYIPDVFQGSTYSIFEDSIKSISQKFDGLYNPEHIFKIDNKETLTKTQFISENKRINYENSVSELFTIINKAISNINNKFIYFSSFTANKNNICGFITESPNNFKNCLILLRDRYLSGIINTGLQFSPKTDPSLFIAFLFLPVIVFELDFINKIVNDAKLKSYLQSILSLRNSLKLFYIDAYIRFKNNNSELYAFDPLPENNKYLIINNSLLISPLDKYGLSRKLTIPAGIWKELNGNMILTETGEFVLERDNDYILLQQLNTAIIIVNEDNLRSPDYTIYLFIQESYNYQIFSINDDNKEIILTGIAVTFNTDHLLIQTHFDQYLINKKCTYNISIINNPEIISLERNNQSEFVSKHTTLTNYKLTFTPQSELDLIKIYINKNIYE